MPNENSKQDGDFLLWIADRFEFFWKAAVSRAKIIRQIAKRVEAKTYYNEDAKFLVECRSLLIDGFGDKRNDTWIIRLQDVIDKVARTAELTTHKQVVKPPLGLLDKKQHDLDRAKQIVDAMSRYIAESKDVPPSWVQELQERLA